MIKDKVIEAASSLTKDNKGPQAMNEIQKFASSLNCSTIELLMLYAELTSRELRNFILQTLEEQKETSLPYFILELLSLIQVVAERATDGAFLTELMGKVIKKDFPSSSTKSDLYSLFNLPNPQV